MAMNGARWAAGLALVLILIAVTNSNPTKAAGKTVLHTKVKTSSNSKDRHRRSLDVGEAVSLTGAPRLPASVTPLGYKLNLIPDPEGGKFKGHIQINLTCHSETDTVTLHAHDDLQISHSEVALRQILEPQVNDTSMKINHPLNYRGSATATVATIAVSGTKMEPANQWYVITLGEKLKVGALYQLNLDFSGTLDQVNSEGFFRGSYVCHRTKERKWFAGTRMRPNKARKVFPCFDEPSFKVPFEISIARRKQDNTISNMALRVTEPMSEDATLVWDHYMTSPPMSTFSVGVFVSDFEFVTPVDNGKYTVPVRVYGQPQLLSELEATANLVPMVVEQIEQYLATAFPLTKVDLVAVPHYNAPDPADHWGLVLFKESDLIGEFSHWRVNTEMVYQWLGHLTTPEWWDGSLVNRALTTFIVSGLKSNAMKQDYWGATVGYSLYYQYSLRNPYGNLASQDYSIRSSKAMWLLRMLNYTMTGPVFRRGLQNFFQNRKFHTFTECDLWSALQQVTTEELDASSMGSEVTVQDVAKSWMMSDHFPVVTVTRDYDNNTAVAEQHTFLRERPHNLPGKENMTWYVPIMYISQDNMNLDSIRPVAWLKGEKEVTLENLPASDKFIIVNPEEIGMFMVNYDPTNWALLAEALVRDPEQFTVETRSKLLHDAWNLGYGGELSLATVLDLTRFLPRERQFTVWDNAFTMLDHLGRHTGGTLAGRKFTLYMGKLIADLLKALETPSPEQDLTFLKLKETAKYVLSGVSKEHYKEASAEFGQWMESEDPDEGNPVKDKCFCTVFKWGTTEEWEFGLDRVVNFPPSRVQSERSYILKTLAGCPNESYKVERILNVTILEGNGNFSDADIGLVLSMLTGSHNGYSTLFRFLIQNWDTIKQRFDNKPYMWVNIVGSATGLFKTQEGLDMVSELYVARQGEFGAAESVMERSLKVIKEEARWSDENLPVMEAWLDQESNQDLVTAMG